MRKLFFLLFAFAMVLLNWKISSAKLWDMTVGDQYKYNGSDSTGNTWEYKLEVVSSNYNGSDTIFRMKKTNYENDGESEYFYLYSNDYQIYVSDNGRLS